MYVMFTYIYALIYTHTSIHFSQMYTYICIYSYLCINNKKKGFKRIYIHSDYVYN